MTKKRQNRKRCPGRGFEVIKPLASSSSGNAYLIGGRSPLLLDCGLPYRQLQKAAGYQLASLAGCLVTHEHGDHSKAAKDLMKSGVDLYCSQGTADALKLDGHRLNIIKARQQFRLGGWQVLPFETEHDAKEPLGFLLAADGERILYATDTFYIRYRFPGLTHILLEVNFAQDILDANIERGLSPAHRRRVMRSHMSLETAKGFLRANDLSKVREIWLCHLSDGNSDAERFKREIQATTGKPVFVAEK